MSDDTGEFFPFRDEGEDADENPSKGRPRKGDETRAMAAADDTALLAQDSAAETTVYRAVRETEATTVYRPAAGNDPWAEEEPIWAGRAGVRTAGPGGAGTEWVPEPPDGTGARWLTPVLVTIVALVLLGLLGWGIYLIVQNSSNEPESPAPAVTVPAAVPSAATGPAREPPSPAATSATPSSTPPSTPSDVAIPALRGLSLNEARAALSRTGLSYRLRFVATTEAPPDTVIASDPAEGTQVPADTVINLILADEPSAAATTPPAPSTGPSTNGPEQELDQN